MRAAAAHTSRHLAASNPRALLSYFCKTSTSGIRTSVRMEATHVLYPPYLPQLSGEQVAAGTPAVEQMYPHGIRSMSKGTTVYDALRRLTGSFEEVPLLGPSLYVRPGSVLYQFDGRQRRWDVVEALPSVGVVLYHTQLQCFLLVRQFRPPVYASRLREAVAAGHPPPCKSVGFTYELCAGVVDKAKTLRQIAHEEIMEEVGYHVPPEALQELGNSVASAGTSGSLHHMFFAMVDESMRAAGAGGGLQDTGECIEVLALPLDKVLSWVMDGSLAKSPGALFGVTWGYHMIKSGMLDGHGKSNGASSCSGTDALLTDELTLKPVLPT